MQFQRNISVRGALLAASAVAAVLSPSGADAAAHGPICQWWSDPATTMTIQWVEVEHIVGEEGSEGEWAAGPAGFGYGDGDDATTFEMVSRYQRLYIRRAFDLPPGIDPKAKVILELSYDDAFIVYLNGSEVAREGIGGGAAETASQIEGHEAGRFEEFQLGEVRDCLRTGGNVIALEGHNDRITSSDFSLHPRLILDTGGDEPVELIPKGAAWEYLAAVEPEARWTMSTLGLAAKAEAAAAADADSGRPDTSYVLEWREKSDAAEWQKAALDERQFGFTPSVVRFANLDGLTPDSEYEFRLTGPPAGEESGENDVRGPFTFRTAPAEMGGRFHFVTGGDMYHSRGKLDAMNRQAAEQDPLFALLGGDLAYANGRDEGRWHAWLDSWAENALTDDGRMVPMVVAIGNHEVDGGTQPKTPEHAPFFYSLFRLPEGRSNYALDFGNYLSLIMLDSDHSQPVADQTDWLDDALRSRDEVPFLFVCYHRPTYGTPVKINNFNVRSQWVPLFEQHLVDAVFENDHHVYKRTKLIRNDREDPDNGILYIGDGAWGVSVREIPQTSLAKLTYIAESGSINHLLAVTITDGSKIRIEATKADGEVFDEVELPARRAKVEDE